MPLARENATRISVYEHFRIGETLRPRGPHDAIEGLLHGKVTPNKWLRADAAEDSSAGVSAVQDTELRTLKRRNRLLEQGN